MSFTNTENTESETNKKQSDDVGGKPLLLKFGCPTKVSNITISGTTQFVNFKLAQNLSEWIHF